MGRFRRVVDSVRGVARRRGDRSSEARLHALEERLAELERHPHHADALLPVMAWIEQARLETQPLISVVMPTHDRAALLTRAIDSVVAQSYPRWELIVVDDASQDETPALLQSVTDQRIRSIRVSERNSSMARNAALDCARGELIAYLDDDNVMHQNWLKSVAWAFEQRPDTDVLYGAFVVDDFLRLIWKGSGSWPSISLNAFDEEILLERGLTDISAIAHRVGLPEARFDEGLTRLGDWDLLLRLSLDAEPLVLPAIASFYYTSAADRLSQTPLEKQEADRVRSKARAARGA